MFRLIGIVGLVAISTVTYSQSSKKEVIDYHRQLSKIDTNEVKLGRYLHLAKDFEIETFISYYLENGKIENTKKYGILTISELFKDAEFTYFVRAYTFGLTDFFKVKTIHLDKVKYDDLDGKEIRERFVESIVPESDKSRVVRKERDCTTLSGDGKFTYHYDREINEILITYRWKVVCDFVAIIIKKTYTAKLDVKTKTFK